MSKRNLLKFADLCNISPIKERIQNILELYKWNNSTSFQSKFLPPVYYQLIKADSSQLPAKLADRLACQLVGQPLKFLSLYNPVLNELYNWNNSTENSTSFQPQFIPPVYYQLIKADSSQLPAKLAGGLAGQLAGRQHTAGR